MVLGYAWFDSYDSVGYVLRAEQALNALIFNGKKNPSVPKNALLAMGRYGQSVWGDMCNVTT